VSRARLALSEKQLIGSLVDHFIENKHQFERIVGELNAAFTTNPQLRNLVHSLKWRIKDPGHLRDKLQRKLLETKQSGQSFAINQHNLFRKITDLVGFRILHLFPRQIEQIHPALLTCLTSTYKLKEKPFARTWDDESRTYFKNLGIRTVPSVTLYTSVHYVFITKSITKFTCEIQVRTLSEELWGEVDHIFNYPYPTKELSCSEQIKVLARATSTCSRLVDSIFRTQPSSHRSTATPKSRARR
jgi:GTP pyrophosphokinase